MIGMFRCRPSARVVSRLGVPRENLGIEGGEGDVVVGQADVVVLTAERIYPPLIERIVERRIMLNCHVRKCLDVRQAYLASLFRSGTGEESVPPVPSAVITATRITSSHIPSTVTESVGVFFRFLVQEQINDGTEDGNRAERGTKENAAAVERDDAARGAQ
jgi:hypothetical protein